MRLPSSLPRDSLFHLPRLPPPPHTPSLEEGEKVGLRSTTACLGLDSGPMVGPPQVSDLAMPYQPPVSSSPATGHGKLFLCCVTSPAKALSVSKLLFPISSCPHPHPKRSLTGLSSKFGVWGDAGVRWLRVRAGGGARWAQNITHMFPVHPPKALPTHSLTGGEDSRELNPLAAFRK